MYLIANNYRYSYSREYPYFNGDLVVCWQDITCGECKDRFYCFTHITHVNSPSFNLSELMRRPSNADLPEK